PVVKQEGVRGRRSTERAAPLPLVAEHAVGEDRPAGPEREPGEAVLHREADRMVVARLEQGPGGDARLGVDAEDEDPRMRSPPLDQRAPAGAAVERRGEEPAVAAGVLERMAGERNQKIAEALPDVRLVQLAAEGLVRLDVGHEADRKPEPLDATHVVLARRASAPVAGDDLLER